MFYEYAVEPQAIGSNWQTFRYIVEKFGFDKDRLISEFPKHWLREVYQAAAGLPDNQRKRIEVALKQVKERKVVRFGRPYDPDLGSWVNNALAEHERSPFHAIIAAAPRDGKDYVLCADDLDEDHPLLAAPTERAIPRDTESLSAAFHGLLRFGSRIVFVDPFFDPYKKEYKSIFLRCLTIVRNENSRASCEIHYRYHEDRPSNEELEHDAGMLFRNMIPEGMVITIFCWKEREAGEDFHARYLLTEKGGIRVDAGFEPVGDHQTTDVTLMDFDLAESRLAFFSRNATAYELVEPVIEVHSDGKVNHV